MTHEGAFDDALRSLRVSGTLLLHESYSAPWAVAVPESGSLRNLLSLPAGVRAVAFHLVEFGHCEIDYDGSERVVLRAGDMAVCFGGAAHTISVGDKSRIQDLGSLLAGGSNAQRPDRSGDNTDTRMLCGVFLLHHVELNPLLAALPCLMHSTHARAGAMRNLSGVASLLADELHRQPGGSRYVIERLVEVLCAEAVRAHIERTPAHEAGWFRGIKDPVVGRAMAAIHAAPGADWSVQALAREVSISPSRFAARFSGALGQSPMAYVATWRMNLACRKLATSALSIDQIGAELGYESHAAFNRAFKKLVGLPPATWRARERHPGPMAPP